MITLFFIFQSFANIMTDLPLYTGKNVLLFSNKILLNWTSSYTIHRGVSFEPNYSDSQKNRTQFGNSSKSKKEVIYAGNTIKKELRNLRYGLIHPTFPYESLLGTSFYNSQHITNLSGKEPQKFSSNFPKTIINSETDTLRNPWNPPFYVFEEEYQVAYEVTKFVPWIPCSILLLRTGFWNYDSINYRSKMVSFLIFSERNNTPDSLLFQKDTLLSIPPDTMVWIEVVVNSLFTMSPFFVGHFEHTPGPPSSLVDLVPQGINYYRLPGMNVWYLDSLYDYLHEVVIKRVPISDTIPPTFQVTMLRNPYLTRLVDFWILSSEILINNQPPESTWILLPDSSIEFVRFLGVSERIYRADYTLRDTGLYLLFVKGRDFNNNWGVSTFEFSAYRFQPVKSTALISPDGKLRIIIPSGSFGQDFFLTIYKSNHDTISIYKIDPHLNSLRPIHYQLSLPSHNFKILVGDFFQNNWYEITPVWELGRLISFTLMGIYDVAIVPSDRIFFEIYPKNIIKRGDVVKIKIPPNLINERLSFYNAQGRLYESFILSSQETVINTENFLKPGVYLLFVKGFSQKLIVLP